MVKVIKNNIFFFIVLLGVIVCFAKKNSYLPMVIVSHPDSQIAFSTGQDYLEQTWQSQVKKISGISVPYEALDSFSSDMHLRIFSDDYSEILADTIINHNFVSGETGELFFEFGSIPVIPGERYRIQVSFVNFAAEGGILIDTGSNYSGCTVDGVSYDQAAAFNITYIKNSRLFWILSVFFPLLSVSLLFMTIWNRKWEETVGLSLIAAVFIMYVAGLTEHLLTGVYSVYILSAICLGIAVYLYNHKHMTMKDLFSPGIVVYGLLFLLILINCNDAWLGRWDEYSHWGLAAKDMFYYDSFAKHYNTTVMLPRYLPFSTLVEYFFVFANGLFSQELLYVAYQTAMLSVLILICRPACGRWKYLIPAVSIIVFVPVIFFIDVYNSIYADPLLAVLMAYVLICYFSEKMSWFNMSRIVGGLFALTMAKDAGAVMAGLVVLVMLADSLYRQIGRGKIDFRKMLFPGFCLVLVVGFFLSWQLYMSIPAKVPTQESQVSIDSGSESETQVKADTESETQVKADTESETRVKADIDATTGENAVSVSYGSAISASGLSFQGIWELLQGNAPEYKYQSIRNFITAIFDNETFWFGSIGISYVDLYIIVLIIIGALHYFGFWEETSRRMLSFGIFTLVGALCYGAFLEVMYIFAFSIDEAILLSSNTRYFGSYVGGTVTAFLYLILYRAAEKEQIKGANGKYSKEWGISLLMASVILISFPMNGFVMKNMDYEVTEEEVYGTGDMAEVLRSFARRGDKIYYICNNSSGYSYFIFRVTASPLILQSGNWNFDILASRESVAEQMQLYADDQEEVKGELTVMDADSWADELQGYQYVFINHPNEMFAQDYSELFENPETIDDGTFYEVLRTGDGVMLHYIGKVGIKNWK